MFLDDDGFDYIDQSRNIPILHVHGTEDPINSYYPGGNGVDILDDQFDFNSDQNINIFDVLTLSDIIY